MSAAPLTDGGSGVEGEGSSGQSGGPRFPLKSPPPPQPLPRSGSPPSPPPPPHAQQQQQQQQQRPRSPRERVRRAGYSPLAVIVNPPSLDNEEDLGGGGSGGGVVDSLSLALEELRATGSTIVGLPQPKSGAALPETVNSASTAVCALPPSETHIFNGSCGSSVGSRSDEEFLSVRPVAKRSSSLKSKKTPPGTPSQVKKAVRFADAFGLDLANVKHVLDPENPPEIPPQATRDLELGDDDEDDKSANQRELASSVAQPLEPFSPTAAPPRPQSPMNEGDDERRLATSGGGGAGALYAARPAFSQPGHSAGFGARVMAQKVVLESARFATAPPEVHGYVRVANLAFEKSVSLRVTFDGWRSSAEVPAAYVPDSSSGMTDQFTFSVAVPAHSLRQPGVARIAFCVAYNVGGQTYWDNNFGENYAFDCVPSALLADSRGQRF